MIKDVEYHQQQQQNPNYPTQMPSAPPTYDEVMHNNNVTATPGNPPYPNVTTYPNTAPYPNAAPYPSSMPYPQQPGIFYNVLRLEKLIYISNNLYSFQLQ